MSHLTTQVRWIIEQCEAEKSSTVTPDYHFGTLMPDLYKLTGFPIYDENYREPLLRKIFGHYYMRSIGFETIALFVNRFEQRMNEIMPYYNMLYKSAMIELNPMQNESYDMTRSQTDNANSSQNTKQDSTSKADTTFSNNDSNDRHQVYSDTPQGLLSDKDYATNVTNNNDTSTSKGNSGTTGTDAVTGNATTTNDYMSKISEHYEGLRGMTMSDALLKFRETFLNIDMMVIRDLEDLFVTTWETGGLL